jgi:hypothetical protein
VAIAKEMSHYRIVELVSYLESKFSNQDCYDCFEGIQVIHVGS